MRRAAVFDIESAPETIILTMRKNQPEPTFMADHGKEILELFDDRTIKNVVIDLHETDYFGSATLGFFIQLWKIIIERKGCMALCCLSEREKEILKVTNLDQLCAICDTRAEALQRTAG